MSTLTRSRPTRSGPPRAAAPPARLPRTAVPAGLRFLEVVRGLLAAVVLIAVAVGEGKSNAEISATLYLSVPTVKTHVSRILTKLDLNNRVQIALLVHDAGLLH